MFATSLQDIVRNCIPIRIADHHDLLDVRVIWFILFLMTPRLQERTSLSANLCYAGEVMAELQDSIATGRACHSNTWKARAFGRRYTSQARQTDGHQWQRCLLTCRGVITGGRQCLYVRTYLKTTPRKHTPTSTVAPMKAKVYIMPAWLTL